MELLHRMRRFRRRSIIHECGLEHEIVEAFKHEICELKDQFDQYDRDKSGFLDRSELNLLIADCGLGPRSKAEREEIQDLIDMGMFQSALCACACLDVLRPPR